MAELNKILLNSGLPGVEAHFKKQIEENDRKWFKLFFFVCILYIGFWCYKKDQESQPKTETIINSKNDKHEKNNN